MTQQDLQEYAEKMFTAYEFANRLVRIENDIEAVVSQVFNSFHKLGFKRVRIYLYRDGKCFSWRCCDGHAPDVQKRFNEGKIILSPSADEPDNFASMKGDKIPLIIMYDPQCDTSGIKQDSNGRHVFLTHKDPWYGALGKPKLEDGETFEWLDCPLLVGNRILGKITMDCLSKGVCFNDTYLALTAPLSFLVASALERNPLYEYDIFLSYHTSRLSLAQIVTHELEQKGLRVFLATRTITPGENLQNVIREAILRAEHILSLFSPECKGNEWVYAECSSSWLLGKDMTVLRVDGVQVDDLPFFMRDRLCPEFSLEDLMKFADNILLKQSDNVPGVSS